MKIQKIVTIPAGTLMLVTSISPILAQEAYSMDTNTVIHICKDTIDSSSNLINDIIDGIEIEKEEQLDTEVYNGVSYSLPVTYTYVEQEIPAKQTMTVDEFLALYGKQDANETMEDSVPVDTSSQEEAYQQALANYNTALAEYEAASQMIETTKDVEVEITEEVTDDQGNVTEVTRTEIQTVTEMAPAGDIDAAKVALDNAQQALDTIQNDFITENNTETPIDQEVVLGENKTYSSSGTCGYNYGTNLTWTLDDDGLLTISGSGDMQNYYGTWNAPWKPNVKKAVIENGVTSIGSAAFVDCSRLTSIMLPSTLTSIGELAFSGCSSLKDVYYVGGEYEWSQKQNVISQIPSNVTMHYNVKTGTCGDNLDWMLDNGTLTINGTGNMYNYDYKSGPWGKYVYTLIINSGVNSIGSYALYDARTLRQVIIPDSVTRIGENAFGSCTALSSVSLPASINIIENYIFSGCQNLTNVSIPTSVTSIGNSAFSGCTKLTSITIPNSVTNIGMGAFTNCSALTNIKLSNNLTSIPSTIFQNCSSLTSISIPSRVTSIGDYSFQGCTGLTSITIPENVSTVGFWAFFGCSGLKSVIIPASVTSIKDAAFYGCTNLKDIYYDGTKQSWNSKQLYTFDSGVTIHFKDVKVTSIQLDQTNLTLEKGSQYQLQATVLPKDAYYTDITWISSNTNIVTVKDGFVSAVGNGTATISVKSHEGDVLATCNVKVGQSSISVNGVTLNKTTANMNVEETLQLIATVTPSNATNKNVTWSSSNTSIATVSNGFVKAIKPGTATITVTTQDGNYLANCQITIDGLPFTDVAQDAWYYSVAKECYETGLINGTSATTFSPMQEMTRAMVVTILWRMEGQPKVDFNNKFSDVSSKQWYATSISWAEKSGVVHGYGDGTFKPDAAVTREQVAVMLANYATYKGVYVPGTKKLNTYPDGSQVSTWAQAGMKWALTNGIVSGNGAGYLNPKKSATRAEGAAMLLRMKNWL